MTPITQLYRNAYSGLSKETWFLTLVMLINRSGTMVIPFMSLYVTKELGFSVVQAGFLLALFGAGSIAGAFIGGKIADKIGFQSVQLGALFGGGIMFITLGFLKTFPSLATGCFVLSMINESFRPANSVAIAAYSAPENRTRSYSLNRLAINLGWALGGAIGGVLAARDYSMIFWVDGGTNIFAACLLMIVLPKRKYLATTSEHTENNLAVNQSAYQDKNYVIFTLLVILFAFSFFHIFTILPVYLQQKLKISEESYGVLMAFNGLLIAVFEMVIIYQLEKRRNPLRNIAYGTVLVGLSYAMYNVFPGAFWLGFSSIIVATIGEILAMPFMNTFWVSRSKNHNRGQYAAMYTMAWGIAQVSGPWSGGWIAEHYGFDKLWWLLLLLNVIAAAGFYRLTRKPNHEQLQ